MMKVLQEINGDDLFSGPEAWRELFDHHVYEKNGVLIEVFNPPRNIVRRERDGEEQWLIRATKEVEEFVNDFDDEY